MALEGTLRDFSLADIFQLIGLQRKTGVLTLTGQDTVTVTFLDGQVVAADSLERRLDNRLGHVLVKKGTITEEQLNKALEIQKETLQRLGFILVNYEFISRDQLREALQMQILGTIYRLFRWQDGEYHFSQETSIEYDRENVIPITSESILMEGARMIDEWPIIEKRIRSYDMVLRHKASESDIEVVDEEDVDEIDFDMDEDVVAAPPPGSDQIKISADEKATWDLVNGHRSVREIVEMSRLGEFDTCKNLYELMSRDLIEEVKAAGPRPVREEATVGEQADTEVPTALPLPLVALVALWMIASILTFYRNPLNDEMWFGAGNDLLNTVRKSISLERVSQLGRGVEEHVIAFAEMPEELADLVPGFASDELLLDPWGNHYTFIPKEEPVRQFLVIGAGPQSETDTDLFLTRNLAAEETTTAATGGIELID